MATFGERITKARKALRPTPTVAEIAREVGMDPSKLQRWVREGGEPPISMEEYFRLSDVLRVSILEIVSEETQKWLLERYSNIFSEASPSPQIPPSATISETRTAAERVERALLNSLRELAALRQLLGGDA